MKRTIAWAVLIGALALTGPVRAQSQTNEVAPTFTDGRHTGCVLKFGVDFSDIAYHEGATVRAEGSLNLLNLPDSGPGVALKLTLQPGQDVASRVAPSTAYLIDGYDTNAADQYTAFAGDDAAYWIFGFSDGQQTMAALDRLGAEGTLEIGYTLNNGSLAQRFTVQLTPDEARQWSDCEAALLPK